MIPAMFFTQFSMIPTILGGLIAENLYDFFGLSVGKI